jgi:hypothetical protein
MRWSKTIGAWLLVACLDGTALAGSHQEQDLDEETFLSFKSAHPEEVSGSVNPGPIASNRRSMNFGRIVQENENEIATDEEDEGIFYEDEIFFFEDDNQDEGYGMEDEDLPYEDEVFQEDEEYLDEDEMLGWEENHRPADLQAVDDVEELLTMIDEEEDEAEENYDVDGNYTDFWGNSSLGNVTELSYDERRLMGSMHDMSMHMPLSCNANLTTQPCDKLTSWPDADGQTFVVPCGECFEVDIQDGSTWELPHGLRIEGKLYIPANTNFILRTTFVFVLGLLKIDPPNTGNKVKFQLYGKDEVTYYANMSGMKCDTGCNMGSKAIAVLGEYCLAPFMI